MIPAGFEPFFIEVDRRPKEQPPERSQIEEIARRYSLRFLPESSETSHPQETRFLPESLPPHPIVPKKPGFYFPPDDRYTRSM